MTKARDISKLLSTANGKIAGENLDVSFENITDTGTEGTKVASGTTAERGSTAGQLRFNSETGLAEYYTGTAFKAIDAPPTVTSIDTTLIDSASVGTTNIGITGQNFTSGATVKAIGSNASEITANSVTFNSQSSLTANFTNSDFINANEPYDIKVINPSGLSATLDDQINVDVAPTWNTASGTLGTIDQTELPSSYTLTSLSATDTDGDTVSYSQPSGSLPSGLILNSSTGAWSGNVDQIASTTTFSFTGRASSGTSPVKTTDRSFSITQEGVLNQYGTQYAYSLNNDFLNDGTDGRTAGTSTRMSFDTASRGANFNTYMANCWDTGGQSYFFAPAGNDINFGTGDFTIEFWVYLGSSTSGINTSCRMFQMGANDANGIACIYNPNTGEFTFSNTHTNMITDNPSNWVNGWHYFTATSESGTKKLWRDGTLVGSNVSFNSISIGTSQPLYFGVYPGDTGGTTGWSTARFQEVQITKGVAKYTSNFTPPTSALLT